MRKLAILMFTAATLSAADISVGSAASVTPGQTLTLPVTLQTQGAQIVGLQFNLTWDKANLAITTQTGGAAAAAKKVVNQSDSATGALLLILGSNFLDLTPIADGSIVDLTIKVGANTPPGVYSLTLTAASGSDAAGKSVALGTANGSLTLGGGGRAPANLSIPNLTVSGSDPAGVTFVVAGDLVASDTISVAVDGQVGIGKINDNADTQQVNAAGVFTAPDPGGCMMAADSVVPTACSGALLIGNNALGFFPLFSASAANGAGTDTSPTSLALSSVPLSAIFGPEIALPDGTTLVLKVNDLVYEDNSGSFGVSPTCAFGLPASGAAAPAVPATSTLSVAIGANCTFTAASTVPWIRITNGASGTASGVVSYTVDANNGPQRNGEIAITSPAVSSPAHFWITQAASSTIFTANVKNLSVPNNLVIPGTDAAGTSFVVLGDYTPTDTMTLTVSGQAALGKLNADAVATQQVNAAGVFTAPDPGGCITTPIIVVPSACAGALLIGNGKLGFRPLFPSNPASGLGSGMPPITLSVDALPLSSIFGSGVAIPSGTTLFLKLNDSTYNDNSGAFRTGTLPPGAGL